MICKIILWLGISIEPCEVPPSFSMQLIADRLVSGGTYIVAGDSTRDNIVNDGILIYESLLAPIGVEVIDTAQSGLSGRSWLDSIYAESSIDRAIAKTPETGATTVIEYSFGINDHANGDFEYLKNVVKGGLDAYLQAKPDALVLLVSPVYTGGNQRALDLQRLYTEIAMETDFSLIDAHVATATVYEMPEFYQDLVHPTSVGTRRLLNYVMHTIFSSRGREGELKIVGHNYVMTEYAINDGGSPRKLSAEYVNQGLGYSIFLEQK